MFSHSTKTGSLLMLLSLPIQVWPVEMWLMLELHVHVIPLKQLSVDLYSQTVYTQSKWLKQSLNISTTHLLHHVPVFLSQVYSQPVPVQQASMLMELVRVVLVEFPNVLHALMMQQRCLKFNVQLVMLVTRSEVWMEIIYVERITVHLFIGHQEDVRHAQLENSTLWMMSVWPPVRQPWLCLDLSVSVTQLLTSIRPDICVFLVHPSILTVQHALMIVLILKEIVQLVQQELSQLIKEIAQ